MLPRSALGINEYLYMLSLRHPGAVRCVFARALTSILARPRRVPCLRRGGGGRGRNTRWDVAPEEGGLRVHTIKMRQHYETPAAVVATVRRLWAPDFDAMASPVNAVCSGLSVSNRQLCSSIMYVQKCLCKGCSDR